MGDDISCALHKTLDILRSPFRHFIKTLYTYAVKFGHIKLPFKRLLCKKRLFQQTKRRRQLALIHKR
jgi:hypothetical protein